MKKCIMCEKNREEIHWMTIVKFEGTDYFICQSCFDILSGAEFFNTKKEIATNSNKYTKKKIPAKLSKKVYERDAYRCIYCNSCLDLTCDHIVPESKGGETTIENLATCCKKCNIAKGVMSKEAFINGESSTR
jgi:hypothetical protein